MEPNRAIELHDSSVTAVSWVGPDLHVAIDAYVHASDGAPAVDAGSGWSWSGVLVADAAELLEPAPGAFRVLEGAITVSGHLLDNILPLPFEALGRVRVELHGANDVRLVVVGAGARFVPVGEPRFIERVEL